MKKLTIATLHENDISDFAAARNRVLQKANTEWVFFCDTDEQISERLMNELNDVIKSADFDAYDIQRLDHFLGRDLLFGETGSARFVRLAKKDAGKWRRPIHEKWEVHGRVGHLNNPLIHHSHKSIDVFLDKINRYSSLDAAYRYGQGVNSSLVQIAIYPLAKFVKNYLVLRGYRDGLPGLIMAIMMSFHSYLTWTKLYLLWHKK